MKFDVSPREWIWPRHENECGGKSISGIEELSFLIREKKLCKLTYKLKTEHALSYASFNNLPINNRFYSFVHSLGKIQWED